MHTTGGCDSFCSAFENFCGQRQIDALYFSICKLKEFLLLPNRSDVLPVNMRCTRAAVDQYAVVCRGVWTCLKSVRFFLLVLLLFSLHYFSGEFPLSHTLFFLLTCVYLFLLFF